MINIKLKSPVLIVIVMALGILPSSVFAQVNEDWVEDSDIDDAKLVIEKQKVLTLPKASRSFGKMNQWEKGRNTQDTAPLQYKLRLTDFDLPPIDPSIRVMDKEPPALIDLYQGYARVGFGNYLAPYAQAYYGSGREQRYRYGIGLQHFSAFNGPVDQGFSGAGQSAVLIHGKLNGKRQSIEAQAGYQRRNAHYYGYEAAPSEADSIRQVYHDASFNALWTREELSRNSPISLEVGLDGSLFSDDYYEWEVETALMIKGRLELNDNSSVRVAILPTMNLRYSGYDIAQNRSFGRLAASWVYQKDKLKASIGARAAYNMDSTTTLNPFTFYPEVSVQYEALPSKLYLKLYALGDLQQNTLRKATRENPFLDTESALSHSHQQLDAGLEVNFAPSSKVAFTLDGGYELVENRMLMANAVTDYSRFSLLYDTELAGAMHIGAKVAVNAGRIKASFSSDFKQYSTKTLSEAYHLPTLSNHLSIGYYHPSKLTLKLEGFQWSGIMAIDESGQDFTLDPIIDLNLTAEYQLTDPIGVFLQLKNITAQNYERYYRYPVRGFQILGGGTFRF